LIDFDRPITLVILNAINQSLDSGFFYIIILHFYIVLKNISLPIYGDYLISLVLGIVKHN